jgi:phage shock protein A
MSIFKRIRDISSATINDLIDKAEDPVKMLSQYLRDMEKDIADAEVGVAKQISIEKRFKQQYDEAKEMVEKRAEQAVKALEAGNENWLVVLYKIRRIIKKKQMTTRFNMKMPNQMRINYVDN